MTHPLTTAVSSRDELASEPSPAGFRPQITAPSIAVLLVAGLAFLLASFPARNSDLWLQLAAGRALVPFRGGEAADTIRSLAGGGQSWLCNFVAYGLFAAFGGTGLVLAKALLVAGLAILLMRLSRSAQGWWPIWALCATLAVLAMGPYLLLRPATVSFLLLALVLWILRAPTDGRAGGTFSWLPPWPLLAVFVIWGNVDRWFVLGLGVTALVWLGELIDDRGRASRGPAAMRRGVWLVVLAAAGLLNPANLVTLARYGEWGGLWPGAADWTGATRSGLSPFQSAYLAGAGSNPTGWAYFALLGLGLMSFVARGKWASFLPWVGLAALSAFEVRVIPFFAVLAGPVLAWNLAAHWARRVHIGAGWNLRPLEGIAVCWLVGLLICAWPGLLQGPPYEPRRWAVEPAPALQNGALTVRRWQEEGKLNRGLRGLHLAPESAAAFAWFCPEVKGRFDRDLARLVRAHAGEPGDWTAPLRAAGIDYLIVHDVDRSRLSGTLEGLLTDPAQWPLLALQGDLVIFGWRGGPAGQSFAGLELDIDRLAFHPEADRRAPSPPAESPKRWWQGFWKPAPAQKLDRDAAEMYVRHAEALRRTAPQRHLAVWEASQAVAAVGAAAAWPAAAPPSASWDAVVRLFLFQPPLPEASVANDRRPPLDRVPPLTDQVLAWQNVFALQRDDSPGALLYLAIRAARRGAAADPDDVRCYLALGEAYLRLLHNTRERDWGRRMTELVDLRRAQAAGALNRALALRPDLPMVHFHLGALFTDLGFLDLALKHRRAYLDLARKTDPPPNVSVEQFRNLLDQADEELNRLSRVLTARQEELAKGSSGKRVADRAELAERLGLADTALETLLASNVAAFGSQGLGVELKLLLAMGRVNEVLEWMEPAQKDSLGAGRYHWLRARALAAAGDYGAAQEECAALAAGPGGGTIDPARTRARIAALVGQALLDEVPEIPTAPAAALRASRQADFRGRVIALVGAVRRQADATVLRGLLALEQGDERTAAEAFRLALALCGDGASGPSLDFSGRPVALGCLKWSE